MRNEQLRSLQTTRDLSPQQRALLEMIRTHQFGRIEDMQIREGQPELDRDLRVIRTARLGGESLTTRIQVAEDFELKQAFCDLFDELERLNNGMVIKLEFRHGLPFLLETSSS